MSGRNVPYHVEGSGCADCDAEYARQRRIEQCHADSAAGRPVHCIACGRPLTGPYEREMGEHPACESAPTPADAPGAGGA